MIHPPNTISWTKDNFTVWRNKISGNVSIISYSSWPLLRYVNVKVFKLNACVHSGACIYNLKVINIHLASPLTLTMETIYSSNIFVNFYHATNVMPRDNILHSHSCKNPKSQKFWWKLKYKHEQEQSAIKKSKIKLMPIISFWLFNSDFKITQLTRHFMRAKILAAQNIVISSPRFDSIYESHIWVITFWWNLILVPPHSEELSRNSFTVFILPFYLAILREVIWKTVLNYFS